MSFKKLFLVILLYIVFISLLSGAIYGHFSKKNDAKLRQIFLVDDGYVVIAREFVGHNESLLQKEVGPGLPLLYSPIFLFPDKFHSILRLFITVLVNVAILVFLFLIMQLLRSNDRRFFYAALLAAVGY